MSLIGFGNHVLAQAPPEPASIRGVEIRGIASATGRNAPSMATRHRRDDGHNRRRRAAADPGTDGVLICSNQPEHYEHIVRRRSRQAMPALVEKPMVTRIEHFPRLLRRMVDRDLLGHRSA